MSRTIEAAGAVVLRRSGRTTEVAVVHRPRYDDWSLPKGKLKRHEPVHLAATREVAEETGLEIRLGVPLNPTQHSVGKSTTKRVRWWVASVAAEHEHVADREVDDVRWLTVAQARKKLSYADERKVLDQALAQPATTPVIIVRHGKALSRKRWGKKKPDWLRPLAKRGQAQAEWLVEGLTPWRVAVVATSPSTRCSQTVEPYAKAQRLTPLGYQVLTEETGEVAPGAVGSVMAALARAAVLGDEATVVCGHRPLLPVMCEAVGAAPRSFDTGQLLVAHLDRACRVVAIEDVRNRRPS